MKTQYTASSPPLLRLGHVMAFTAYLRHIGAPVDRHLCSQKLPVLCDDPDMFVPLTRIWAFFAEAARREDADLGWRVGAHAGDHNLNGALLRKLETAPTLYRSLKELVRMVRAEATHLHLGIRERRNDILFFSHYPDFGDVPGYGTSQAYQLQIFLDLIRHFLGRNWVPDEVGIEDPRASVTAETNFPGARVRTSQPMGYISVPRACLHEASPPAVSKRHASCGPEAVHKLGFVDGLRAVLPAYLPDGYPSARFSATLMNVSERTLARRLAGCGLTYGMLIDEVRFAEAKKLLLGAGVRIEDVAISVGFSDQSNFTRMFRRIGGLTPTEYRKLTLH
jgi:AraC-like DNA-binding protein